MYGTRSDIMGGAERREANKIGRQRLGKESQETGRARGAAGTSLAELAPASRAQEPAEPSTKLVHLLPIQRIRAFSVGGSGGGVATG